MTEGPSEDGGRWPVWRLGLMLYPFVAAAVAINAFMAGLLGKTLGLGTIAPVPSLAVGAVLGIPATIWAARKLRALMDEADG
jgi:hypothetical protein